jgi:hypothetical protein
MGINVFLLISIAWKMCNITTHNTISALQMTYHQWHLHVGLSRLPSPYSLIVQRQPWIFPYMHFNTANLQFPSLFPYCSGPTQSSIHCLFQEGSTYWEVKVKLTMSTALNTNHMALRACVERQLSPLPELVCICTLCVPARTILC